MKQYIDATYLKDFSDLSIPTNTHQENVLNLVDQAIRFDLKLVMISPSFVFLAKNRITDARSKVLVGTVIDFPEGNSSSDFKLEKAKEVIDAGVDELDFVINYQAFKKGKIEEVKSEVLVCTKLCLQFNKKIKWIIETAALTDNEIIRICALIKNVIIANFSENDYQNIFVKSSTGFFKTENGIPNGATRNSIILMLENASPLLVKASGGIRNYEDAENMIKLGVHRIGTSAVSEILNKESGLNYSY